jgi:hypothetical protein
VVLQNKKTLGPDTESHRLQGITHGPGEEAGINAVRFIIRSKKSADNLAAPSVNTNLADHPSLNPNWFC